MLDEATDLVRKVAKVNNFTGYFDVYTVYERLYLGKLYDTYGLIHTDHEVVLEDRLGETIEENSNRIQIFFEHCHEVFVREAALIHEELIKSGIKLDYFFIMPYFTVWNSDKTKKNSYLLEITTIGKVDKEPE